MQRTLGKASIRTVLKPQVCIFFESGLTGSMWIIRVVVSRFLLDLKGLE